MSIDGNWIRRNEVKEFREGPFVEENVSHLMQVWNQKFRETSALLNKVASYLKMDKDDISFPDDSQEITLLTPYVELYTRCCNCNKQSTQSIRSAIEGFDMIINGVKPISSRMQAKLYGRGVDRKEIFERRRLELQLSIEQLMQAQQIVDDTSREIDEMRASIDEIFDEPRRR